MKDNFYRNFKKSFGEGSYNANIYCALIDSYLNSLKCKGTFCGKLSEFKKVFSYILGEYKKLLKQKNQNDEIFSQILHDIKSPMLGIKFALEESKRNKLEDEIYKINSSVLNTIQDFLLLYSFKNGFSELDFENFSLYEAVIYEVELYTPLLKQKKMRTDFLQGCSHPDVCSNRSVFARIVSNLISNAIKYSPPGGIISFYIKQCGKFAFFDITNKLQPQHFADKDKMFEEFNTQDKSTSFGLGLFISKRLAKRINSTISVKKHGDEITFELKMPKTGCRGHEQ